MKPASANTAELDTKSGVKASSPPTDEREASPTTIYVIDDDPSVCRTVKLVLASIGASVECFGSAEEFIEAFDSSKAECVVLDMSLPKMSGLELLTLFTDRHETPVVVFSGNDGAAADVGSLNLSAVDFCAKSAGVSELLDRVRKAVALGRQRRDGGAKRRDAATPLGVLTCREREILGLLAAGKTRREIGGLLGISYRTVESHRANMMRKTASDSLPSLIRLFLASAPKEPGVRTSSSG